MRARVGWTLGFVALALCLAAAVMRLRGDWGDEAYRATLLIGSIAWFFCAGFVASWGKGDRRSS